MLKTDRFWLCPIALACLAFVPADYLPAAPPPHARPAPATAHPVVAGFERFFAGDNAVPAAAGTLSGGRLLLGELNCTSCHRAEAGNLKRLSPRQAPVLDGIGARVNIDWLRRFIAAPHKIKPGTTMPQLFGHLPPAETRRQIEALVHFLASTGTIRHTAPDPGAAGRGKQLFHRLGCFACHGSLDAAAKNPRWCIPLGNVGSKYSVSSLRAFLRDPHKTRPSGRMPNLNLSPPEAADIASFFLKDIKVEPNLRYKYYEGRFEKVPDFTRLKPKLTGASTGFDLNRAPRKNDFGMRFEGYLHIERDGEYTFHAGSDDGSRVTIDGKQVVLNDGHHPFSFNSGQTRLKAGSHPVSVDYMQGGGEWSLKIEYQGPGVPR